MCVQAVSKRSSSCPQSATTCFRGLKTDTILVFMLAGWLACVYVRVRMCVCACV